MARKLSFRPKVCTKCHRHYTPTGGRQMICAACRGKAKAADRPSHTCGRCGAPGLTGQAKLCGTCRGQADAVQALRKVTAASAGPAAPTIPAATAMPTGHTCRRCGEPGLIGRRYLCDACKARRDAKPAAEPAAPTGQQPAHWALLRPGDVIRYQTEDMTGERVARIARVTTLGLIVDDGGFERAVTPSDYVRLLEPRHGVETAPGAGGAAAMGLILEKLDRIIGLLQRLM